MTLYIYIYTNKTLSETAKGPPNFFGHIDSIGLRCFLNCLSLFHLVFYVLQSNTRYFVHHLERHTYYYICTYIHIHECTNKEVSVDIIIVWI